MIVIVSGISFPSRRVTGMEVVFPSSMKFKETPTKSPVL
jgi:hypothetical protein